MVLPKRVAIEVIKDLDRLDMCDSLLKITELKMENMARELGIQDRVIEGQQGQIERLNEIIANHNEIDNVRQDEVDHWKAQYKRQRRQKLGMIGIFVVVTATLALVAN